MKNIPIKEKLFVLLFLLASSFAVKAQSRLLYGFTVYGGDSTKLKFQTGYGTMFSVDPITGMENVLVNFDTTKGIYPLGAPLKGVDGMLYGVAFERGKYRQGTLFRFNPTNNDFTVLYNFTNADGEPQNLVQLNDSTLYGTAYNGSYMMGELYSYNLNTGHFKVLINFNGANGKLIGSMYLGPMELLPDSLGNFYGITEHGGTNDMGVLYRYKVLTGQDSVLIDFGKVSGTLGTNPYEIWQFSKGHIIGLNTAGGYQTEGTIFSYNVYTEQYSVVRQLENSNVNYDPKCRSPFDSLYYAYQYNRYSYDNYFAAYYDYPGFDTYTNVLTIDTTDGKSFDDFTFTSDGFIYGMVSADGRKGNFGFVFKFNPTNEVVDTLVKFNGYNGANPLSNGLVEVGQVTPPPSPGVFFGIASSGGKFNKGTLFSIDPSLPGSVKTLVDFDSTIGSTPYSDITEAWDNMIYGLTRYGGKYNGGVLYRLNPASGKQDILVNFNGTGNGPVGYNNIIEGIDSALYFMGYGLDPTYQTSETVFLRYNIISGRLDTLTSSNPFFIDAGEITQAKNGVFYGEECPYYDQGGLFGFDPATKTYFEKNYFPDYSFQTGTYCQLTEATNGLVYGVVPRETARCHAYIYGLNPQNNLVEDSAYFLPYYQPVGALLQVSDSLLYGLNNDEFSSIGRIFKCNIPLHKISDLGSYNYVNGNSISENSGFTQGSNGLLYSLVIGGGTKDDGMLFSFNPVTNMRQVMFNFDSIHGTAPPGRLLLLTNHSIATATNGAILPVDDQVQVYPSPCNGLFNIQLYNQWQFIKVFDMTGKEIYSADINSKTNNQTVHVNLSACAEGLYVVQVSGNNGTVNRKIIIQR